VKTVFLWSIISALSIATNGQCIVGSLSPVGPGCGCFSGCNLSAFGGPNCGAGVLGDCFGGPQFMSISFSLPEGCEMTVVATIRNYSGCFASAADLNDYLKVEGLFSKSYIEGNGNITISDSVTQTGGVVAISAFTDRADEIVFYELYYESGDCPLCLILPIELVSFSASLAGNYIRFEWTTLTEVNNDYFTIEQSEDGFQFIGITEISGQGNSTYTNNYEAMIPMMDAGMQYFRLRQTDFNGQFSYGPVIVFDHEEVAAPFLTHNSEYGESTMVFCAPQAELFVLKEFSAEGKLLQSRDFTGSGNIMNIPLFGSTGLNIVLLFDKAGEMIFSQKYRG